MSDATKFRFVSPGIFLNEVDQSQLPAESELVGPVIIGRSERGPGMIPVKIGSFSEFVEKFGNPIAGKGGVADVWRNGNYSSPTYAAYAAQAYLKAGVGPITFLRLMGTQHPDALSAGYAGWKTTNTPNVTEASNGGAFGLFVFESGTSTTGHIAVNSACTNTGSLAAVWYVNNGGSVILSGNLAGAEVDAGTIDTMSGSATLVKSDSSGQFKALIYNSGGSLEENAVFSLTEGSSNFIRKVFKTNPQLVNTTIEDTTVTQSYWLGETYERNTADLSLNTSVNYGVILGISSGSSLEGNFEKDMPYRDAHSGWFFAQNTNANKAVYEYNSMQKLFKFVGINGHGSWLQNNIKISIANIKASQNENVKFGTFDVLVRKASDSDVKPVVLERFSRCDLDPGSPNYIAAQIGDAKLEWDDIEKRYREFGDFANRSRYIRVVIDDTVANGDGETHLPFGFYGPPRFKSWTYFSASTNYSGHPSTTAFAVGSGSLPRIPLEAHMLPKTGLADQIWFHSGAFGTASIKYPSVALRTSASLDGAVATTNAYFGVQTGKSTTSTVHDPGYGEYLRAFGRTVIGGTSWVDTFGQSTTNPYTANLEAQWTFSLDEVLIQTGSNFSGSSPTNNITDAFWESGSYKAGTSWNSSNSLGDGATRYQNILECKVNRFTSPLWGGFDALNIKERDPFRNTILDGQSPTETTNYVYYTLRRAINTVSDPEVVSMNAVSIPGLWYEDLTKYLFETCEARADALAIIDVKGGFTPRADAAAGSTSTSDRKGDTDAVLRRMQARNLDSSYGAAYYPWVKIRDDLNGGIQVYMPPSVVALGVLANTERAADVWFAPAGFRRGGLSQGAAGLPVVGVETKLTSRNRDDLYDVNINPIASFPREGIVVFGQKTLQATRSALDRINVRRLLIYVKRGISAIARDTLFQPNVQATWNDFKGRADKFLGDIKVRFGVDDFRVVLDETTTTPDLIDRNIMYAKIFIKPTRAIEFIAIDFIITRSGASFED
jgi:hypothetical protein